MEEVGKPGIKAALSAAGSELGRSSRMPNYRMHLTELRNDKDEIISSNLDTSFPVSSVILANFT